jgi:hypothetical protein
MERPTATPPFTPGESFTIDPNDPLLNPRMPVALDGDQKKLRHLIERRHPDYRTHIDHWAFLEKTYEGGRDWFPNNIFRYIKEGDQEYADRLNRAYRFNHSREVVDLLNKYLFKQEIVRNDTDAPQSVKTFWKASTRTGLSIKDFAKQVSKKCSIYGRIGIIVDNTAEGPVVSRADEAIQNFKTYAYIVTPQQLLDYAYDDSGDLLWALIAEVKRDDQDPMTSTGKQREQYRLWTRTDWQLYEEVQGPKKAKTIQLVDYREHDLGVVPLILADNIISEELYVTPALIDDIAYLDRASANYLSNLDAIIQDQTYSQLAMPAQNVLPGEDNYTKLLEMGTKRVFLYDGEGGAAPFYLSPDVKQAQIILGVINKIINEIYHTVGLAGERTKQDNALGIDNSSGVAKAYDFERVNALLAAKAESLESIESRISKLVALWNGESEFAGSDDCYVEYPRNFDTRGLYDEFDIAARLMLIEAPDTVRRQQMQTVIDKLFPQLAKDLLAKMQAELKDWPVDPTLIDPNSPEGQASQTLQKTSDRELSKETDNAD